MIRPLWKSGLISLELGPFLDAGRIEDDADELARGEWLRTSQKAGLIRKANADPGTREVWEYYQQAGLSYPGRERLRLSQKSISRPCAPAIFLDVRATTRVFGGRESILGTRSAVSRILLLEN